MGALPAPPGTAPADIEPETAEHDTATEFVATATEPERGESPARPLAPGLYLVATPIGNLEDITLRALRVLRSVDRIACEDTRQTAKLLGHYGIRKPTVSYHLHNEEERATELTEALLAGGRIAVVSDAGTPGIADPGAALVRQALAAGVSVFPIPGANAVLSALIASGFDTEQFLFHGFLPAREGQRRSVLERVRAAMLSGAEADRAGSRATHLFYETPHRILDSLRDVATIFGAAQPVVVARELTKLHEEFLRGTVAEVLRSLEARPVVRGEMVLLLPGVVVPAGAEASQPGVQTLAGEVRALMQDAGLAEMEALKRVAKARGLGKSEAYREWQRGKGRPAR